MNQNAKADQGKARLSLVPLDILYDIARIREYGNAKYHDPDNWKTVEPWRYRDAMMRHMCAYITDPKSVDEESGLPHLWHLACNVAFLCALEKSEPKENAEDDVKCVRYQGNGIWVRGGLGQEQDMERQDGNENGAEF